MIVSMMNLLRQTRCLLPLLLLLILAVPARAETPSGLPDIVIRDNVTRTVLKNGLTVLVVEDHTSDIVGLEMLFRVGQVNENDSTAGITNLIQNVLVKRISKTAGGDDPYGIESKGSLLSADATPDYAEISLLTDAKNFPDFLRSIGTAVSKQEFDEAEITDERRRMVEYLEGDQRVFRAIYEIFLEQFYRYHPYRQPQEGHPGSVRQLNKAKLDAFYQRFWAPNRTVISIVGDVDRKQALKVVEETMSGLSRVTEQKLEVSWEPKAVEKELFLASGSNLAWIFVGYPAPGMKSPDYMPMKILHTVLGDGLSSRLWVELREKRGLAYELGSIYPMLEGPGHLIEYIVTTPKQLRESQSRIFKEIKRMKAEPITAAELEAAKRRLIGSYLLERETNKGQAFHLGIAELLGSGYQYDLQVIDRIRRVTQADVQRVARLFLDNFTLVVARPRDTMF